MNKHEVREIAGDVVADAFEKLAEDGVEGSGLVKGLRRVARQYRKGEGDRECPQLEGHNSVILGMLRAGKVTNVQIASVSMNHTARISNIRAWLDEHEPGTKIFCRNRPDLGEGVTEYELAVLREPT